MSSVGSGREISQTSSKTWILVSDGADSTLGSWRRGVRMSSWIEAMQCHATPSLDG